MWREVEGELGHMPLPGSEWSALGFLGLVRIGQFKPERVGFW